MNSKQIEAFLAVAENLSFTATGEMLFASQSTVSRQIHMLENELGFPLFLRNNNTILLTPAGAVMVKTFRQMEVIFQSQKKLAEAASKGCSGTLVIGFMTNVNLPDIYLSYIDTFRKKYPDINLSYLSNPSLDVKRLTQLHTLDVMIGHSFDIENKEDILSRVIARADKKLVYGIRHRNAGKENLSIKDFQDEKVWICSVSDTQERKYHIKQVTDYYGMREFGTIVTEDPSELLLNVRMGKGIVILDSFTMSALPSDLKEISIAPEVSEIDILIMWNKNNFNPSIPLFVNLLDKGCWQDSPFKK